MTDVGHELGALKFVVDKPLSSKVAMFNTAASKHQESQLLNPFSNVDGRRSPKPTFSKDEYGKPLAGSMTEMRGQKANIHVLKEMLELCQIIDSEGYPVSDEPDMRVIPFGELFNIYNYISDKVVGICLRARKHKLIDFEGEMLFQRRDDNVPVFLLKPIKEVRQILEAKQHEIRRSASPAPPQATSVLLDKKSRQSSVSPATSKASSPAPPELKKEEKPKEVVEPKAQASAVVETIEIVHPLPQPSISVEPPTESESAPTSTAQIEPEAKPEPAPQPAADLTPTTTTDLPAAAEEQHTEPAVSNTSEEQSAVETINTTAEAEAPVISEKSSDENNNTETAPAAPSE